MYVEDAAKAQHQGQIQIYGYTTGPTFGPGRAQYSTGQFRCDFGEDNRNMRMEMETDVTKPTFKSQCSACALLTSTSGSFSVCQIQLL